MKYVTVHIDKNSVATKIEFICIKFSLIASASTASSSSRSASEAGVSPGWAPSAGPVPGSSSVRGVYKTHFPFRNVVSKRNAKKVMWFCLILKKWITMFPEVASAYWDSRTRWPTWLPVQRPPPSDWPQWGTALWTSSQTSRCGPLRRRPPACGGAAPRSPSRQRTCDWRKTRERETHPLTFSFKFKDFNPPVCFFGTA